MKRLPSRRLLDGCRPMADGGETTSAPQDTLDVLIKSASVGALLKSTEQDAIPASARKTRRSLMRLKKKRIDDDYFCDELAEDSEVPDIIREAMDNLNKAIVAAGPLSWYPSKYAAVIPEEYKVVLNEKKEDRRIFDCGRRRAGRMIPRQLEILQHALGVDKYGLTPKGFTPYTRNRFCAGAGDEPDCRELVKMGYMVQHETTEWLPYFNCSVTTEGMKAMHKASPAPPKVSRSAKRFEEYQTFSDAFDCTFRQWLDIRQTDWYKDMKAAG
ncbi:unnamed protein product [Sphagnum jensenii]